MIIGLPSTSISTITLYSPSTTVLSDSSGIISTPSSCPSLSGCTQTTVIPSSCLPTTIISTIYSSDRFSSSDLSGSTCTPSTVYPSSCGSLSTSSFETISTGHTVSISIQQSSCPSTTPICTPSRTQNPSTTDGCTFCGPPQTQSSSPTPTPPVIECRKQKTYLALFILFLILFIIFFILFLLAAWRWWHIRKRCKCSTCGLIAYNCPCGSGPMLGTAAPAGIAAGESSYASGSAVPGDQTGGVAPPAGGDDDNIPIYPAPPGGGNFETPPTNEYGKAQ